MIQNEPIIMPISFLRNICIHQRAFVTGMTFFHVTSREECPQSISSRWGARKGSGMTYDLYVDPYHRSYLVPSFVHNIHSRCELMVVMY